MNSISKNVYIDNLADIFNNKYKRYVSQHNQKSSIFVDIGIENDNKGRKFKVGDHVIISKCKNIFANVYVPHWSEKVFVIKKVKILCCGHILLVILTLRKFLEGFTKKNCKRQINQNLKQKKNN